MKRVILNQCIMKTGDKANIVLRIYSNSKSKIEKVEEKEIIFTDDIINKIIDYSKKGKIEVIGGLDFIENNKFTDEGYREYLFNVFKIPKQGIFYDKSCLEYQDNIWVKYDEMFI